MRKNVIPIKPARPAALYDAPTGPTGGPGVVSTTAVPPISTGGPVRLVSSATALLPGRQKSR